MRSSARRGCSKCRLRGSMATAPPQRPRPGCWRVRSRRGGRNPGQKLLFYEAQGGSFHREGGVHPLPVAGRDVDWVPGPTWSQGLAAPPGSGPCAPGPRLGDHWGDPKDAGHREGQADTVRPAPRLPLQGPSWPARSTGSAAGPRSPAPRLLSQPRGPHPSGSHRPAGPGLWPCATPGSASVSARRAVWGGGPAIFSSPANHQPPLC